MSNVIEFKSRIGIKGVNPYVPVSDKQASEIRPNWRKPMPVLVQVNGKPDAPWHINMMPTGNGGFYLYLHNNVRESSKTKVGDIVTVRVWFDEAYRNGPAHAMPLWFEQALEQNPVAASNWIKLPPSRQKEVLRNFDGLKSDDAINRNLMKAVYVLNGNSGRFMARDWTNGK